jgi:propionyl-CoA carboxylase alpha chain
LTYAGVTVNISIKSTRVSELESLLPVKHKSSFKRELVAPLTGSIVALNVEEGDIITQGQEIVTLTAMKMENIIVAEHDAKVSKVHVKVGENVNSGQLLIEFVKNV